jgi:hypothetical protein
MNIVRARALLLITVAGLVAVACAAPPDDDDTTTAQDSVAPRPSTEEVRPAMTASPTPPKRPPVEIRFGGPCGNLFCCGPDGELKC